MAITEPNRAITIPSLVECSSVVFDVGRWFGNVQEGWGKVQNDRGGSKGWKTKFGGESGVAQPIWQNPPTSWEV